MDRVAVVRAERVETAGGAAQIAGVYIPCWTYDCGTTSDYTGQRGDDYWDTETLHDV